MIVALTGFMGSGKSCVGRILARKLSLPFVDLDEVVESAAGMKIPEIISSRGEGEFRKIEAECLESVLDGEDKILSLGGGTLLSPGALELLKEKTELVCLEASEETIVSRIRADRASLRPLFDEADFKKLYAQRKPYYEAVPRRVKTDGKSPEKVAEEIIFLVYLHDYGTGLQMDNK